MSFFFPFRKIFWLIFGPPLQHASFSQVTCTAPVPLPVITSEPLCNKSYKTWQNFLTLKLAAVVSGSDSPFTVKSNPANMFATDTPHKTALITSSEGLRSHKYAFKMSKCRRFLPRNAHKVELKVNLRDLWFVTQSGYFWFVFIQPGSATQHRHHQTRPPEEAAEAVLHVLQPLWQMQPRHELYLHTRPGQGGRVHQVSPDTHFFFFYYKEAEQLV